MPHNPQHNQAPQQHNQARSHNRKGCGCLGCLGVAVLGGGLVVANLLFGGCDNNNGTDNNSYVDVYPPKSETPTIRPSSPDAAPHTPKPTTTTTPESSQPTPSQSSSKPEQEAPADPMATMRRSAADRYLGCALVGFTRTGGSELTLDLSLQSDTSSISARNNGRSERLNWNDPRIVLTGINDEGEPVKPAYYNAEIPGDPNHPNNPVVFPPSNAKNGATMGVWIETDATTNYQGEAFHAVVDRYCGAFTYSKDDGWRLPAEAPEVQDAYYNDRRITGGGS